MKHSVKVAAISSIILLLILLNTDPQRLPAVVLIVPFALLFIALAAIIYVASGYLGLSRSVRFRAGMVGASAPVVIMVLQSLGQLTPRDTLVIFALFALVYFYMSRLGMKTVS